MKTSDGKLIKALTMKVIQKKIKEKIIIKVRS